MVRPHLGKRAMTLVVFLLALGLLVYLFTAMIWPEKF